MTNPFLVTFSGYRFGGTGPEIAVSAPSAREACAAACTQVEGSGLPLNAGRDGRTLGAFDLDNAEPRNGWWRYRGDGWKADVTRLT